MGKIVNFLLLELKVMAGATQARYDFGSNINTLTSGGSGDVGIKGIEIITAESVPVGMLGVANATFAQIQGGFLVLSVEGKEGIKQIPLVKLLHLSNTNGAGYFSQHFADDFDDIEVDWSQSYIVYPAPLMPVANLVFMFGINYGVYASGTLKTIKKARR